VAQWAFDHFEAAGLGTDTLPGAKALYLPLKGSRGSIGVMAVRPEGTPHWMEPDQRHLLDAFASQTALALERALLSERSAETQRQMDREQLRNALLSSVSHDLRTPLGGILGAASTLQENEAQLGPSERQELVETIHGSALQLQRLVSNLLDVTRLESGVVEVKKGYITGMVEKPEHPKTNLAIVGIYSFRNSATLYNSLEKLVDSGKTTKGEIQFTDALAALVRAGHKLKPVPIEGWYDCGKPETLLETNRYILDSRKFSPKAENSLIIPPVYISPTARVENSIIGPYVSIGDGARVDSSIISDSIVNEKASIININLSGSLIGPSAAIVGRKDQLNVGENSEIKFDKTACDL